MIVLSLFDGISCGQLAFQRAGITVKKYYASEIDEQAIKITQKHFPDTIQLGDIRNFEQWEIEQPDIIIGGSPCQDLSCAGNKAGLYGEQSSLFFEFVKVLKKYKPKFFLLENNASMAEKYKNEITSILGVEPILINSALVSAQNRKRLYWTNIPGVEQPADKGLYLRDIVEPTDVKKEFECWDIIRIKKEGTQARKNAFGKMKTLDQKANCLGTTQHITNANATNIKYSETEVYIPTPVECERLQTLPDNYTDILCKTRRYKAIGNGWTVDVIAHIFSYLHTTSPQKSNFLNRIKNIFSKEATK